MHTKRKRRFYAFCGQFIGRILIMIIMNEVQNYRTRKYFITAVAAGIS